MAPKLIGVDLKGEDNFFINPFLHVYGYVVNIGQNIAYNSRIHVILYQPGGVVAVDTYIPLYTINGESGKSVDSLIYYSGTDLSDWTLTLEWTES
jgi:hypothetical protein